MNKKYIFIIVIILVISGGVLLKKIKEENDYEIKDEAFYTNEAFRTQSQESIEKFGSTEDLIKVHITGEVNNPGLIELNSESRILDAIEKAGGTTPLADISKVNLAYILSDGEKIYIPSINDVEDVDYIINSTNSNSKVNINIASVDDLKKLNGVGESIAQAIVDYRKENGKYSSIEDIKNVSGIGESKYNKIKDYICVK